MHSVRRIQHDLLHRAPCPRTGRDLCAVAFTLVELLVVIAIVSTLLSVLLPSLSGAREAARASACRSNLRQLSIALDMYSDEHKDVHAPGASDMLRNLSRWHGSRPSTRAAFTPEGGALTPYLTPVGDPGFSASKAARTCPTFAPITTNLAAANAGFERSAGGYGYNNAFVGTHRQPAGIDPGSHRPVHRVITDAHGSPRAMLASPTTTIAFADAALADGTPSGGGLVEYSFIEPRYWPDYPQARPDPSTHFRHALAANVAWLDGHATTERRTFSASSGVFPIDPATRNIGWFGAADTNALFGERPE